MSTAPATMPSADDIAEAIAALQKEKKSRVIYIGLFFIMTALFGYFTYNVIIELLLTFQRHERVKKANHRRNARYDLLKNSDLYDPPVIINDDINYNETIRGTYENKDTVDKTITGQAISVDVASASQRQDKNSVATCKTKKDAKPFLYYLFSPLVN